MKNADKPINPIVNDAGFCSSEFSISKSCLIGLTKREYFAAMAMQGLLSNYIYHGHYGNSKNIPMVAEIAVQQADELLKQLDQ